MRTATTTSRTRVAVGHPRMRRCTFAVHWLWSSLLILLIMIQHHPSTALLPLLIAVEGFTPPWTGTTTSSSSSIMSTHRKLPPATRTTTTAIHSFLLTSSRSRSWGIPHHQQEIRPARRGLRRSCLLELAVDPEQPPPEGHPPHPDGNFDDSNDASTTPTATMSQPQDEAAAQLRAVTFCHLQREQEPELLCDLLLELGACAAYLVDADRGTDAEEPLFRPIYIPDDNDDNDDNEPTTTTKVAAPPTFLPVWKRCNVTAHFPASIDLAATVEMIRDCWQPPDSTTTGSESSEESSSFLPQWRVEPVPNRDWVVHVQQSWKPIVVAQHYVLRFPWHTDQQVAQAVTMAMESSSSSDTGSNNNNNQRWVQLQLQGGIAFGTGEHPTTQLCLEWLHGIVSNRLRQMDHNNNHNNDESYTVLDYGSGSGILGMAACALDSSSQQRVRAVGIDLDVDACRIANANAMANGNLPMRNYLPPLILPTPNSDNVEAPVLVVDYESQSLILKAHAYARKQQQQQEDRRSASQHEQEEPHELILPDSVWTTQKYDVGVANILAGPLQSLAPTLAALLKPGAPLGLSGILHHQGPAVVQAYQQAGFVNVEIAERRGDWVLVTAVRQNDVDDDDTVENE